MTMTLEHTTARAEKLNLPHKAFIDGAFCASSDGATFPTLNPATGEEIASVAHCSGEDVDRAVKAARRAFNDGSWSRAAPEDRKEVLLRLAELVRENAEDLAVLESLDSGKTITDCPARNRHRSCQFLPMVR